MTDEDGAQVLATVEIVEATHGEWTYRMDPPLRARLVTADGLLILTHQDDPEIRGFSVIEGGTVGAMLEAVGSDLDFLWTSYAEPDRADRLDEGALDLGARLRARVRRERSG